MLPTYLARRTAQERSCCPALLSTQLHTPTWLLRMQVQPLQLVISAIITTAARLQVTHLLSLAMTSFVRNVHYCCCTGTCQNLITAALTDALTSNVASMLFACSSCMQGCRRMLASRSPACLASSVMVFLLNVDGREKAHGAAQEPHTILLRCQAQFKGECSSEPLLLPRWLHLGLHTLCTSIHCYQP